MQAPEALDADGGVPGLLQLPYLRERTGILHGQPRVIHGSGVIPLQCCLYQECCLICPVFLQKAGDRRDRSCAPLGRAGRLCYDCLENVDLAGGEPMAGAPNSLHIQSGEVLASWIVGTDECFSAM